MKNAFQEKSPKGFPDIKRANMENLRGENPKVWYGDSNAAIRM